MPRRRLILLLLVLVLGCAALFFFGDHHHEPSYNGLTLSQCLEICAGRSSLPDGPSYSQAIDAVEHIGTNALPWLVEWTACNDSASKAKLRALLQRLPRRLATVFRFADPYDRRQIGTIGFAILGERASPAVPDLVRVIDSRNSQMVVKLAAVEALEHIGRAGVPILLRLIAERRRNPSLAIFAVYCLSGTADLGTNRLTAAALLIECLQEKDLDLTRYAAEAIGWHRLDAANSVPLLEKLLHHSNRAIRFAAAGGLGRFGEQAQTAVPQLLEALKDPTPQVSLEASNALHRIAPHVLIPPN